MSRIDELIEKLCPDGVEFKSLGNVLEILNGFSFKSGKYSKEGIRVIRISDVQKGRISNKDIKFYPLNLKSEISKYLLKTDDLVMSLTGNTGRVAMISENDLPAGLNQRVACLRPKNDILIRYVFHILDTDEFEKIAMENSTGGGQQNLSTTWLATYKVPVPPLAIQEKIVEILDKFTQLETELETELEARKAQYQFYRNQLLAFENKEVEWKSLGEVGTFTRGKRFVRTDMIEKGFPCLHYGEMYTHYNVFATESKSFISPELAKRLRVANPGDVVIVAAGETIEDIGKGTAWLGESDIVTHDACFSFKSPLNPKYVSYFLRTRLFHDQIKRHISSGKISSINAKGLATAKIPVPPMEEQNRIVKILDQFDDLVNNISSGLPAEIKARRQQYEYYRAKLLTFKVMENN